MISKLIIKTDPKIKEIFDQYPDFVKDKMQFLRELVIETVEETENVSTLEETLKWGKPSFITKYENTIRMDWKPKMPNQYALYFQYTSRLVETFKMVFDDIFQYEGKRAIIFRLNEKIQV